MILRQQSRDLAAVLQSQRIDVICDRSFEMTLLAAAACAVRPTRRLSYVDCDPERDFAARAGRFARIKRYLLRRAYRHADRVVATSGGVAASVRAYFHLPADHVVTIPNCVDLQRIARMAEAYQPPLAPDRFHIVSVGRLHPQKGYFFLLEAIDQLVHARQLGRLQWWILGEGEVRGGLESEIQGRGLHDHIQLVGFQANPLPYVKHAHLYCMPSLYEGMPNALLEAVCCGTPVLASDCPSGPSEILDGGRWGRLVPPGNPQQLATAIEDAVANYESWRSLAGGARAYVEQNYSLAVGIAALEKLLQQVVSSLDQDAVGPNGKIPFTPAGPRRL